MEELNVVVKQNLGSIDCNFQEIKEALALQMTAYTSLEITEDGQKEAKNDLATLRKIRKAVDDKRKDVKKSFMQPYTEFEDSVKELLAVIDEPISMIDGKLKEFETKRIEERQTFIQSIYDSHIGEYREYLPLNAIKKDSWNNKSTSEKDIIYDISEAVTKVRSDIEAIKALHSEIEEDCIRTYKNTGNNLAAAITRNSDYISAKARAEETVKKEPAKAQLDNKTGEIIPEFTFKVSGKENIEKVKDFLSFSEIPYMEV